MLFENAGALVSVYLSSQPFGSSCTRYKVQCLLGSVLMRALRDVRQLTLHSDSLNHRASHCHRRWKTEFPHNHVQQQGITATASP
eukprot:4614856-Pyramimonas_sp.AAC.1